MLLLSVAASAVADNNLPIQKISDQEKAQILNQAEDWIDDMPVGLQDRLADAVAHAQRGFYNEIEMFRNMADTTGVGKYSVDIKDFPADGNFSLPFRLYSPKGKETTKLPLLIYFHGGGWSLGSLASSEKFCRALASEGGLKIISIQYPLAPEHPYPEALEVGTATVKEILQNSESEGLNFNDMSLGGEGAGASLALEVFKELPQETQVKSLVLLYPLLKSAPKNDNLAMEFARGYGFDSRLLEAFVSAYAGKELEMDKTLPSTLLIGAGRDIMVNETREFGKQPSVTYIEFPGALHGFISDGHQPLAFQKAVELTYEFLTH